MHCPAYYECPFCKLITKQTSKGFGEIVFESEDVVVFPAKHYKKGNQGNLLVAPKKHIENLYDLPIKLAEPLFIATQLAARVLKMEFRCDGVSIRQHNEPAGGQDVWHYHVHVFPRYLNDNFHSADYLVASHADRVALATRLRGAIS